MKLSCLCCALLLLGCGDSSGPVGSVPTAPRQDAEPDPLPRGDAGKDAGKDAGTTMMDAGDKDAGNVNLPESPRVSFVQPMAASDPNEDEVITSTTIHVRCKVTRSKVQGAADVDKSAIVIRLEHPNDPNKPVTPPVNALPDDEYEATFELSAFPNGPLHLSCEAKDLAVTPHVGFAALDSLLDLGPNVEFSAPKDKGIYALKTPVAIHFKVSPLPLSESDTEAEIDSVELSAGGVIIPVSESSSAPGEYVTTVDFGDPTLFMPAPTASQIRVIVKNRRTPTQAIRDVKRDIAIDGFGPQIVVQDPPNEEIVHGPVLLKVSCSDPSGVQPNSLVADINQGKLIIKSWDVANGIFQQSFATGSFPADEVTQLTINLSAEDAVGNITKISHTLRLDNRPPVLSLDPPYLRHYKKDVLYCSEAFDPVGPDAVNDLQQIQKSAVFRVLVADRTNTSPGAIIAYHAGVNPNSITLYAQNKPGVPLLIDTDEKDGICDDVNIPANAPPVELKLSPVNPKGTAWFKNPSYFNDPLNDVSMQPGGGVACVEPPPSIPPVTLCASTPMTGVTSAQLEGFPPALWAVNPTNTDKGACTGDSWEIYSALNSYFGWVCLAVKGEDNKQNVGVSAPIRVCISNNAPNVPDPACDPSKAPNCLSGGGKTCTMSSEQSFAPNQVWLQP